MTIEELKDLIDSTINENGTKAITGKALNLALNEITNAVAEAATTGGGGGSIKRLYANMDGSPITDEQQLASNVALYTEIVTALTNDELPPQVGTLMGMGGAYYYMLASMFLYNNSGLQIALPDFNLTLTSDGNVALK